MEFKALNVSYSSLKNAINIKFFSIITILLNTFCVIFGVLYITFSVYILAWDIFGIILPITLFENLFLIYLSSSQVEKSTKNGHRIYHFCVIFLIYIMISFFGIMGGNLLLSAIIVNNGFIIIFSYFLIYFFYFSLLILSIILAIYDLRYFNTKRIHPIAQKQLNSVFIQKKSIKQLLKKPLNIISTIIFMLSALFAVVIVFGSFEIITTFIAIIASQFGIFFSLIFLANLILKLNLKRHIWSKSKYKKRLFLGLVISGVLMLPLLFKNISIFNGDRTFLELLGPDWDLNIPKAQKNHFLSTPYTTTGYFLGSKPKECLTEVNIKFYSDGEINLFFDVYMPLNYGINLPGENSTLIRIHGGAWVSGDKGTFNNVQVNKYFAAQGYIVFDIQYGLRNLVPSSSSDISGDYNIDDMVGHIAAFTHFLTNNYKKYGANLNSVFISGGSSGGHLSSVVALATANGEFFPIFSQNLTIKGFIPLYPANGMVSFFGIDGNEDFIHPENLIRSNSPPCLIYQGTHDILNYFNIANNFRSAYKENGNYNCSILWFPLAGHGSDFYFSGYYNQIFLYYMERFMYFFH